MPHQLSDFGLAKNQPTNTRQDEHAKDSQWSRGLACPPKPWRSWGLAAWGLGKPPPDQEQDTVVGAPEDVVPARPVPQARNKEGDHDIPRFAPPPMARAAQWNVDVVAEPRR